MGLQLEPRESFRFTGTNPGTLSVMIRFTVETHLLLVDNLGFQSMLSISKIKNSFSTFSLLLSKGQCAKGDTPCHSKCYTIKIPLHSNLVSTKHRSNVLVVTPPHE
jgi:hypothetical protein